MYSTSDFRNGLKILMDNIPYEIVYFQHVKPGKGGAFVRTKVKNLLNGNVIDRTFRATEKVERADIEQSEMQYMYSDGDGFHFMDTTTYEQIGLSADAVGEARYYLKENLSVGVLTFNGRVINIALPTSVVLTITSCEPGVRGDTVSGATKPAVLETGVTVQVPLFVNEGQQIKVDTRSGEYLERA